MGLLFVFLSPISTILRGLVKLSAVPLNKELFALVMLLDSLQLDLPTRRCSPSNNTRRYLTLLDQVTPLVCLSRVSPRMRSSPLEISSTSRRKENVFQLRNSVLWLLYKSTLESSNLDTVLLSSLVLLRSHV